MKLWRVILGMAAGMLAVAGCGTATATPAQIVFLRHAEKPPSGPELNDRGWERARALVAMFTHDARVLEHGPAVAIFAMKPGKSGGSVRAIQTMEATGRALGVTLDSRFTRDEIAPLVKAILATPACDGKTVIVCWEHKVIPEMLQALGWTDGPKQWPDNVYDRLWVLDFADGKPVRFRDLPQKLLPGDRDK